MVEGMDAEEMFGDIVDRLLQSDQARVAARQKVSELQQTVSELRAEVADLVAQIEESRNG